jgi:hypothetical protein
MSDAAAHFFALVIFPPSFPERFNKMQPHTKTDRAQGGSFLAVIQVE